MDHLEDEPWESEISKFGMLQPPGNPEEGKEGNPESGSNLNTNTNITRYVNAFSLLKKKKERANSEILPMT